MLREIEGGNLSLPLTDRFPKLKEVILKGKLPNHIFIIPDGNGRWAQKVQGKTALPIIGHRAGAYKVQGILRELRELPIDFVTLWGFSVNNRERDVEEVSSLMQLFDGMVKSNLDELMKCNVRFVHLGRKDAIPQELAETLNNAEEKTKKNTGQTLSLAIDFAGADQEKRMFEKMQDIIMQAYPRKIPITEEFVAGLRDGGGRVPPADLIIRTSGEQRLSDLGWICGKQTELYFTDKLFPALETKDIVNAIVDYSGREQRLGGRPQKTKSKATL